MSWEIPYPPIPYPDYTRVKQPTPPEICPCIYFAWRGEQCVYVGQTENLRQRLRNHKKVFKEDWLTWIPKQKQNRLRMEGFYIWLLNPPRNNMHTHHVVGNESEYSPRNAPRDATFQRQEYRKSILPQNKRNHYTIDKRDDNAPTSKDSIS